VTFRVHDHSHNEVQKLETPMRTPLLTTSEKMANLQSRALARDWRLAICRGLGARTPLLEIDPETRFWATFVVGSPLFPNRNF